MTSFLDKFFRWRRNEIIFKHLPLDSVVCDIGCGREPYLLKKISPLIKRGIGLDEEVKEGIYSNLEFKKIRILDSLPLENESCDVVIMAAVLEHLSDPKAVLKESFRVLKNGGKLILTTPSPLAKPILDLLVLGPGFIDKGEISDHKNYFWPRVIKKMLMEAGFNKENIKTGFFELFLNNLIMAEK